jgi:hypothetical protein
MTTSANLAITHLVSDPSSPEIPVNESIDIFDAAVTGVLVHNMTSDADYTLGTTGSPKEWHYGFIEITDTGTNLTAARNIICPTNKKFYILKNSTLFDLTVKTSAGSGIAVAVGKIAFLRCDGTNVVDALTQTKPTGRLSKSVAGGTDVTLTEAEQQNLQYEFTGALTASINVIVNTDAKSMHIYNNTTGAFTLTVKTSAGSGIAVAQTKRAILDCDETNVIRMTADI